MSLFSGVLSFCFEKRADKGEDCYTYNLDQDGNGYIAVFDGSGGAGSEVHMSLNERPSAYIASRYGSYLFDEAMKKSIYESSELENYIYEELKRLNINFPMNKSRSTMVDVLPTTLSSVIINNRGNKLSVKFLWAGDSRGYIIDESGIAQVTEDDVNSVDAYYNIFDDSIMNNRIHGNASKEKFTIHSKEIELEKKSIIFCASDGCYDYFSSPMVFELFIITMLCSSGNFEEAESKLKEILYKKAGDDCTLIMSFYGFDEYSDIVDFLQDRLKSLINDEKYFDEDYWNNKYKKNYYRYK